jgi:hypothetical protein
VFTESVANSVPRQHDHGSEDASHTRTVEVAVLTLGSCRVADRHTGIGRLVLWLRAAPPRCDLSARATQIEKSFRRQGEGQRRVALTAVLELVPAETREVELGLVMFGERIGAGVKAGQQ